ncbi:hypothetical protein KEM56_001523 [Ascosphaera pollenicola]|nr:hypothetical protein KEM56_001523 [Ascosphaera pollenicola]
MLTSKACVLLTARSRSAAAAARLYSARSIARVAGVAPPCLPAYRRTPFAATALPHALSSKQLFSTSSGALKMASDDDYMAFLNKANQDPAAGTRNASSQTSPSQGGEVKTTTVTEGEQVPASIKNVEAYYVSDTDAEFVPVTLKFEPAKEGKWPVSSQFFSLILPGREHSMLALLSIQESEPQYWDPRNQYTKVINAVKDAAGSDEVRIYKLNIGEPRAEYWVLALDKKEGRLVGMKALAIES